MKNEIKNSETKKTDDDLVLIIQLMLLFLLIVVLFYMILPNPLAHFIYSSNFWTVFFTTLIIFLAIIDTIWTHKANKKEKAAKISKNKKSKASREEMNLKIDLMEATIYNSIPESQRENMFAKLEQLHEEREKTRESDMKALKSFINSKTQTLETNLRQEITTSILTMHNETTTKLTEDIKETMKGIVEEVYDTYLESHEYMIKEIDELREEREKIRIKDMAALESFIQMQIANLRSDLRDDVVDYWDKEEVTNEIIDEIKKPIEEVKTNVKCLSEKVEEVNKDVKSLSEKVEEVNKDVKSLSEKVDIGNQEMSKEIQAISALAQEISKDLEGLIEDNGEGFEDLREEIERFFEEKSAAEKMAAEIYEKTEEMVEEKIRQWEEDNDDYLASIPILCSNRH